MSTCGNIANGVEVLHHNNTFQKCFITGPVSSEIGRPNKELFAFFCSQGDVINYTACYRWNHFGAADFISLPSSQSPAMKSISFQPNKNVGSWLNGNDWTDYWWLTDVRVRMLDGTKAAEWFINPRSLEETIVQVIKSSNKDTATSAF